MRPDIHHLTGAYVADALPPQEELLFERHLEECSLCAAEVRELRETTARLALAAAQPPPPGLRQQVLAEIGSVRQQPPPVLSLPGQRKARATWLVRVAAVIVALAIIAALGAVIFRQQDRIDRLQASNTEITEVISAADAQMAVAKTGGASGLVVYSRERNAAVFSSSGLANLPSDRVYQLWAIGPSGATSEGLLDYSNGRTEPAVAQSLAGAQSLGVTAEPAGGSAAPTSDPVLVVPLPA
ncbi:MAG TPA: anti-sigma factor [Actinomycetes bacterium]